MFSVQDCALVQLPSFTDERGSLSFAEGGVHVPFDFKRIYYLYNIPEGAERGAHAHMALHQLMIPIAGSFDILLDDGTHQRRISLFSPDRGLYIRPMIWRELENFSPAAVCIVLASERFDESDYIRSYDQFVARRNSQ
jgi:hypothetical protein